MFNLKFACFDTDLRLPWSLDVVLICSFKLHIIKIRGPHHHHHLTCNASRQLNFNFYPVWISSSKSQWWWLSW